MMQELYTNCGHLITNFKLLSHIMPKEKIKIFRNVKSDRLMEVLTDFEAMEEPNLLIFEKISEIV